MEVHCPGCGRSLSKSTTCASCGGVAKPGSEFTKKTFDSSDNDLKKGG